MSIDASDQLKTNIVICSEAPPLPSLGTGIRIVNGRKRKSCKAEGCTNLEIQGGHCFRHGAKAHRKVCKRDGCKSYVVRAGVCIKHGARQDLETNTEEEPKPGSGNPAKRFQQKDGTPINVDDAFLLINMPRPRAA